jgi:mannose-6-phosphate isomerase-like protein (cupin superfamily)
MDRSYAVHDPTDAELTPSEGSGTPQVDLSDALGCENLRTRVWRLSPGDSLVYHRHCEQEELYVCLQGPGRLHVDGDRVTVPDNGVVRVPPATPRQLFNDTDREHSWLVVGAPPVERDGVHDVGDGVSIE